MTGNQTEARQFFVRCSFVCVLVLSLVGGKTEVFSNSSPNHGVEGPSCYQDDPLLAASPAAGNSEELEFRYALYNLHDLNMSYSDVFVVFALVFLLGAIVILKSGGKRALKFLVFTGVLGLGMLGVFVYNEINVIGDYRGYKPEQPINFSHKLHAGKLNINCLYCHFGAEKSKHAGIPPANVCMNCHSHVKARPDADPNYLIDYNGEKVSRELKYLYDKVKSKKSIEWAKIHNLPDFVYFSHKQHVTVGGSAILGREIKTPEDVKQTCYACHGEVATMDVVAQTQPLTMGWCLDCHRTTPSPTRNGMTVFQAGGGECARCHY